MHVQSHNDARDVNNKKYNFLVTKRKISLCLCVSQHRQENKEHYRVLKEKLAKNTRQKRVGYKNVINESDWREGTVEVQSRLCKNEPCFLLEAVTVQL